MAIITSHTLNGLDGTHASGISVKLIKLNGEILFESKMDKGGRLNQIVKPEIILNAATIIISDSIINITFLSTFRAENKELFISAQV